MTGKSLLTRTGSYPSLQQQLSPNGALSTASVLGRKPSKVALSGSREKERALQFICRYLGRKKVAMLMLVVLALFVFVFGSFTVSRGEDIFLSNDQENHGFHFKDCKFPEGRPFSMLYAL